MTRAVILLIVAFIVAAFLRFPDRADRPMHVDETTQAVKLGELMAGDYRYDPVDHHGPTLLYATLPVKWFSSAKTWSDLTESQLRLVPVLFGMGLLVLLMMVGDGLTPSELAWGALAVAVSPLMVFYSRYYIMEMLLVFFTFALIGCGWRFYLTRQTGWMVAAGVFAGLMHATKETFVLQFAAIGVALVVVRLADLFSAGSGLGVVNRGRKNPIKGAQVLAFLIAATVTSVLIFSQFFTTPISVYDSIATYWNKIDRAGGQGHQKPFFYYLGLIWGGPMSEAGGSNSWFSLDSWRHLPEISGVVPSGRIVWGERLLLVLAGIGAVSAFVTKPGRNQSRHLARFLAVYSVALFLIYSAVSYKTPWLVLGPWHGLLILAGMGAAALVPVFGNRLGRLLMTGLLALGMLHAGLLAYRATRGEPSFAARAQNPLNYSMTSSDCLDWVEKIYRFAEVSGKGNQLSIVQVDAGGGWPLPWYLGRSFPNYVWRGGGELPTLDTADVVLSSLDFRSSLPESIRGSDGQEDGATDWVEQLLRLHSSGRLAIFVRRPIWEAYLAKTPWEEPLKIQR